MEIPERCAYVRTIYTREASIFALPHRGAQRIIAVNDVYLLDNLPSLGLSLRRMRARTPGSQKEPYKQRREARSRGDEEAAGRV
eukprot:8669116-Pyramimonas_sp.AAC.1